MLHRTIQQIQEVRLSQHICRLSRIPFFKPNFSDSLTKAVGLGGNEVYNSFSVLHYTPSRGRFETSQHLSYLIPPLFVDLRSDMDRTVIKFKHCGRDIYSFSDINNRYCVVDEQSGRCAERNVCPVCGNRLVLGLLDAPVALPCPFTDGHRVPCAFLIGANSGPWSIGEWSETELHVGLSDSAGLVYNYTLAGVQRDERGWEQCVCIQLVPPWRDDLRDLWDKELKSFSSLPTWSPEKFHEEREFGSCCYGFALTFINHVRSLDHKAALSRDEFTGAHVLPRIRRASAYIRVYEEISRRGFYIVDKEGLSVDTGSLT